MPRLRGAIGESQEFDEEDFESSDFAISDEFTSRYRLKGQRVLGRLRGIEPLGRLRGVQP